MQPASRHQEDDNYAPQVARSDEALVLEGRTRTRLTVCAMCSEAPDLSTANIFAQDPSGSTESLEVFKVTSIYDVVFVGDLAYTS